MSLPGIVLVQPAPDGPRLAAEARAAGYDVALLEPGAAALEQVVAERPELAVVPAAALYPEWVGRCDRAGVRLLAIAADAADRPNAVRAGVFELAEAGTSWTALLALLELPPMPVAAAASQPGAMASSAASGAAPRDGSEPAPQPWQQPAATASSGESGAPIVRSAAPWSASGAREGRLVVVWGAAGSPGRSTIALNLAAEAALLGRSALLVDADTHAAAIAPLLGLLDEAPGFAAACRLAGYGELDGAEFERVARRAGRAGLRVLTGIANPSRWTELAPSRVRSVLQAARAAADLTVVDIAAELEQDEAVMSDLHAPRRNGAGLAALAAADEVVAVAAADPVGMARFLRAYPELVEAAGQARITVVLNKLRPGPIGSNPRAQLDGALLRFAGVEQSQALPLDTAAADAALLAAAPLAQSAAQSALRLGIAALAAELAGVAAPPPRRLLDRRRGGARRRVPALG